MDTTQRIAQFENMVQADPENDMAHFSLGGAYAQASRWSDSANAYLACVARNPAMTKAYQLAGDALIKAGDATKAAEVLTEGYKAAAQRGDRMPQKAMGELLTKIGAPVPQVAQPQGPTAAAGEGTFIDHQTGRPGTRMARPPFRGPVGQWIFENITKETFDMWIGQGTKVINELRLDLSRDEDSALYDKHMREFLGIDDELYGRLQGTPKA
jgi:Fe-S cluster biosynthesis and repair protein YggX